MIKSNQQEIATPKVCKRKKFSPTLTITYAATLTALCLVLKIIAQQASVFLPSTLKLSLTYLGWYLSAAILGPIGGAAVAASTDIVGFLTSPAGGTINPFVTLGNALSALTFGIVYKYLPIKNKNACAVIGAAAAAIVGTLGINTFGLWFYYAPDTYYLAYLAARLPQLIMVFFNAAIFMLVSPPLIKMTDKQRNYC